MAITVEQRTAIIELVVGMFGAAPGANVLSDLVAAYEAGNSIKQIAANLAKSDQFKSIFPTFMTNGEFAAKVVDQLVGSEVVAAEKDAAVTLLTAQLNSGKSRSDVFADAISALNAVTSTNAAWGNAAVAFDNKVAAAVYYSVDKQLSGSSLAGLQAVVSSVTSSAASLNAAKAAADAAAAPAGQTFTLTTGVDNVPGTAGDDTINAIPGAANANTFTALDNIDGGAGNDTFNVSEIGAAGGAAYTLNAAGTVKNVETLNYTIASDNVGDTLTADVSGWAGLASANFVVSGTDSPVTITTKGNVTAATVNGSTTAGITDGSTADTLATVTAIDATGLVTVTSDKLTTLVLNNSDAGATVTAAAGTRALALTLNGIDGGTVTDAEATSLAVTSSGVKTTAVTLTTAKATSVTVDASVATTITDVNIGAATSLTVKGAGATTVSALSTVTALTSFDASGSAGGLTVGAAIGTGVAFTGGAGKDRVIVGATTKAIATAGGDDTVTINATGALGTGGTINAGDGIDTLKFSTYANAVTASATTTFGAAISGFERLELSGVNAAPAAAVNLANLGKVNYVTLSATNTETTTISNMASGGTLVFTADQTTAKPVTVSVTDAATGTADVMNVVLSKATATALVGVTAANVETINLTSTETATTLLGTVTHGVEALVIADATALNVSGNAGVTITTLTGTKLTSIDASGVTTGLVSFTTGALAAAATIKGGAGANTIVASAATKAVTYTGQDKVDTITINNALSNSVSTAGGNDVIVTGAGADTINAGAGDDNITSGAGLDQLTGGAGADTFVLALNSAGSIYASIKDAQVTDVIQVADKGTEVSFNGGTTLGAAIALGGAATFTDYLNAAAAGDGNVNGIWAWFQFGGNTYLVSDQGAGATFAAATDFVVELTGLVNLTNSTGVATNAITLA